MKIRAAPRALASHFSGNNATSLFPVQSFVRVVWLQLKLDAQGTPQFGRTCLRPLPYSSIFGRTRIAHFDIISDWLLLRRDFGGIPSFWQVEIVGRANSSVSPGRAEIRTSTSELPALIFLAVGEVPLCISFGPAGLHGSQDLRENEGGQHRLAHKAVD